MHQYKQARAIIMHYSLNSNYNFIFYLPAVFTENNQPLFIVTLYMKIEVGIITSLQRPALSPEHVDMLVVMHANTDFWNNILCRYSRRNFSFFCKQIHHSCAAMYYSFMFYAKYIHIPVAVLKSMDWQYL